MQARKTTLERAFELARSGQCSGIGELRQRLRAEGYDERHQIYGRTLVRQLVVLCEGARKAAKAAAGPKAAAAQPGPQLNV